MSKTVLYILAVIVLVVVAGAGGFFAGTTYAQSQAQSAATNFLRQRGLEAAGQNAQGGGNVAAGPCGFRGAQFLGGPAGGAQAGTPAAGQFTQRGAGQGGAAGAFAQLGRCVAAGEVKAVDGNTVQISTAESVVTVKVDNTTQITKTDVGSISDLKPGDRVVVFSRETGDSPTASGIQIQRAGNQP